MAEVVVCQHVASYSRLIQLQIMLLAPSLYSKMSMLRYGVMRSDRCVI